MEIYHHHFKKEEIVGIGPLYLKRSNNPVDNALYDSRMSWFYVYLKSQAVKIESDWCNFSGVEQKEQQESKQKMLEFETAFKKAREEILEMINSM